MEDGRQVLAAAAREARRHAHAPYSGFAVGAALRAADGRIFRGANMENAAYPEGICAETAALATMLQGGQKRLLALALYAEVPARVAPGGVEPGGLVPGGASLVAPCGGCRQRLAEFAGPDALVHLCGPGTAGTAGTAARPAILASITLGELLPLAFGPAQLGRGG